MYSKNEVKYTPVPLPHRHNMSNDEMLAASRRFLESMKTRHTVREYSDRPVAQDVIENCVRTAGTAPSGANHQPWRFVAISDPALKLRIRLEAEKEEQKFYRGGAGEEWLHALEPIGTDGDKPHLEMAPWLIVIFAQRWGQLDDGTRFKNYYVPESVGIATGFLITALHQSGLVSLTHTPNPMRFLGPALNRPRSEKPVMILAVGHPCANATVPAVAKIKKPIEDILDVII